MTGLVRKATLLTLCGLMIAGAALAGVPSANTSTAPGTIVLDDDNAAGPGQRIEANCYSFVVNVRDAFNNILPLTCVKVDFSACAHLSLSAAQPGVPALGVCVPVVDCAGHFVRTRTDALGNATFRVWAASNAALPLPSQNLQAHGYRCAHIYADPGNVDLTPSGVIVATADEDANAGVNTTDQGMAIDDFIYAQGNPTLRYIPRSDFDGSNDTNSADVTAWIDRWTICRAGAPGTSCSGAGCCALLP